MRLRSYMAPGFPKELFLQVGKLIGADVEFDELRSGPEFGDDPFARGEIDLGWICSTSFAALALSSEQPSVQLVGVAWVPTDPGSASAPRYFGDVVVRSGLQTTDGSPVTELHQLGGLSIACNDPISLSGYYSWRVAVSDSGHDPDTFAEIRFTGGHEQSLEAIVAGDVDAAVIDSVVRFSRGRSDPAIASLSVIDRLGPWPVQPLVARGSMPAEQVAEIRHSILRADTSSGSELGEQLNRAGLDRFVEVSPDHYAPVVRALAV